MSFFIVEYWSAINAAQNDWIASLSLRFTVATIDCKIFFAMADGVPAVAAFFRFTIHLQDNIWGVAFPDLNITLAGILESFHQVTSQTTRFLGSARIVVASITIVQN